MSKNKQPNGYWTEEKILLELKKIKEQLGHFPKQKEFINLNQSSLSIYISRYGGVNKFKKLLGEKITKASVGFWTEEKIVENIKIVKNEIGHFPTNYELKKLKRNDLSVAVCRHGGFNYYRKLCGEEINKVSPNYWNDEIIINKLKEVCDKLGHFPSHNEFKILNQTSLLHQLNNIGGTNKFRKLLGYKLIQKPANYWNEEKIIKELKLIINELGHFPSANELRIIKYETLLQSIYKYGNMDYFRKLLGYPQALEDLIGMSLYSNIRGQKSEKEVKKLLIEYCKREGIPEPAYNVKLSKGNVLEFVFESGCGKRIGIDVTNTKSVNGNSIKRKYIIKDYYKYLDELWIVVLSNIFTNEDYIKFNEESPDNVKIMSVWNLIDKLQIDIDEHSQHKLEALELCTIRTKNDLINNLKNCTFNKHTISLNTNTQ